MVEAEPLVKWSLLMAVVAGIGQVSHGQSVPPIFVQAKFHPVVCKICSSSPTVVRLN